MVPILEMNNIEKHFTGVKALKDVSMKLHKGEILAILGENGAGKSTLMKVLTGVYQADNGTVVAFGNKVNFQNYKQAQKVGISIIFQELSLIPHLNVWENVFLGNEIFKFNTILDTNAMKKITIELLATLGVDLDINEIVQNLSVAEQQFVEIAKALSVKVKILILDEPTSTLTPQEVKYLFKVMRLLRDQGVGMVFISHHLDELYEIADNVMILRDGITIDQQPIKSLNKSQLVEKVIGRTLGLDFPKREDIDKNTPIVLDVKNLQLSKSTPKVNFSLRKGEILGFFGLVGSGRTEIVRAIIGADACYHKEIILNGQAVSINNPAVAYRLKIGLLPENRKEEGVILPFSVSDNIYLNNKDGCFINYQYMHKNATDKVKLLSIKTPDVNTPVVNLSGGNQQKVIIARWLSTDCDILIFDEPTRGIDVGAKDEIYKIMDELTKQGKSIILISSEMEEILGISDRIIVLKQNKIQAELPKKVTEAEVMAYAVGGINDN